VREHDHVLDVAAGVAKLREPGQIVVVDNVAQPGPFFAVRDFLAANPDWRELGTAATDYDRDKAFDYHRATIFETDFMVLRAPVLHGVGERPVNRGRIRWNSRKVAGLRLQHGDLLSVEFAGGGGWGSTYERDPERVSVDVARDYVSLERAREDYGLALINISEPTSP